MTATRSRCSTRLRKVSRSLVERSAQCMSSSTSRTGVLSASSASMPSTAPNSCCRAMPVTSPPASSALSRSGRSIPSTGRAAIASASAGDVCAALCSASASGRYGTLSPSSAHLPDKTMNPRAAATVASSATSRVLPMPASPLTRATIGSSATAWSSTRVRRRNSMARPTSLLAGACSMIQVSQVGTTDRATRRTGPRTRWRPGAQRLPSPSVHDTDLASAAKELYALPPGDFTAARDERAAQARAAGDRGLARPVVSAWLVNRLARAAGDQLAELVALGESLRQAQQDLAGERVRELSAQRRQLVATLVAEAKRLAAQDGRPVGPEVEREVEATLQAALADADAAAAVQAGCLASPLSYAGLGVGDVASVATRGGRAPAPRETPARDKPAAGAPAKAKPARRPRETPAEREARRAAEEAERQARKAQADAERRANQIAEAQQAVRQATETLADATAALAQAEQDVTSARATQESARQQVERLDKELSLAVAEESRANRAVRDAQRGKEAAARAADAATRQLARAEAAARRLG